MQLFQTWLLNMEQPWGFFVDEETLTYLRDTGRPKSLVQRVERYCKTQGLFRTSETPDPEFSDSLELDLSTIEPSIAGPKRPQDRVRLSLMKPAWEKTLCSNRTDGGFELSKEKLENCYSFRWNCIRNVNTWISCNSCYNFLHQHQ